MAAHSQYHAMLFKRYNLAPALRASLFSLGMTLFANDHLSWPLRIDWLLRCGLRDST
jgi:hypothetical protein